MNSIFPTFHHITLHLENTRFDINPVTIIMQRTAGIDDAVAREEQRNRVARHDLPDRTGCSRMP